MKKFLLILAFLIAVPSGAQCAMSARSARQAANRSYRPQDIPNVHLLDERRFVSNPDHILSEEAVGRIDAMLQPLKSSGKAQVVVVAVNSIGDEVPFDFLQQLLTQWGVGRKDADDGLGVLLVLDQRAVEIQTGYGVEGDLPDALLKRIINERMLPAFREGDWDGGMVGGVAAIADVLEGRVPADLDDGEDDVLAWVMLVIFTLPILVLLVATWLSGRCPKCHKKTLRRTDTSLIVGAHNRPVRVETYVCSHCGYVTTKQRSVHDDDDLSGGMGGFLGGMLGGMGGGGGFSGGSFGGGSFGGGGARGRF